MINNTLTEEQQRMWTALQQSSTPEFRSLQEMLDYLRQQNSITPPAVLAERCRQAQVILDQIRSRIHQEDK